MATKKQDYGNDSISALKGADRVRKRPGVIFGSDGLEGCEHAVFEILSNSIDEAREGHGRTITVTRFADRSIDEISTGYLNSVAVALGEYSRVFTPLLAGIFELCRQIRDGQFYTQGSTNLLGYPEFHNSAYDLLTLLENRALLQDALEGPENQTLNIKIGKENHLAQLENSTVLVARYNVGQDNTGVIGVIGPVRMDYSKLIPHLEYFAKTLGNLLSDTINPAQE